ncbi:aminotransferase class I/II-fold pyridoxal phosphate-dependent enzyme [Desulfobacterales bacterium HSG16]|nr:aminotransferase class I/II-fold pyridoxal phosphate-dependent enzyme [Desulfobacterales bacterium HSG16]
MSDKKKRIFLSPPHMGGKELEYIKGAFESNYIAPLGPQVDAFEQEFSEITGIPYALALSSGTAAMHLAMRLVGIEPGDEIFASTLTFIGSVTPALYMGAAPVFIDSDRKSWNMDISLLADELKLSDKRGKLPKAVIPTDIFGQCADYDEIQRICDRYEIPVIVDAAESLGATYKGRGAGSSGKAGVFSFNGNKIITTSGGGMLASDNPEFIEEARYLSQQARDPVPYYQHSRIGYNYRMSNILAAVGRGQLGVLNDRVKRKREIFNDYYNVLNDIPGIEFMPEAGYGTASRWLSVILITPDVFGMNADGLCQLLEEENIESRPVWKPMHMQPVFKNNDSGNSIESRREKYQMRAVGGSVAEDLFKRGLCLPSGTQMATADMERIISTILRAVE